MNKMTLRWVLLMIWGVFLTSQVVKAQVPAASKDVMLQAFFWDSYTDSKWTTLESQSTELSQNFDMLWLPPSANSTGWMGYMPIDWLDQTSPFGTPAELKSLIATLKSKGTKCVADIVVNHRNGKTNWCDFPDFTYKNVTYHMGLNTICNNDDGGYVKSQGYNVTGANDTGDDFSGSRDIDHTSTDTQNAIKAYLDFMKNEMGYSGWRYDMVKGYSGYYNGIYNNSANNYYSVGEYWDGSYDALWAWINATGKTSTAFDFCFKYRLNEAYAANDLTKINWAGQPAGLISNGTSKRYSTTFIDNHDTYRDGSKFTGDVLQANAWMLSMPGIPCVFLPHWQQNKAAIKAMIEARRAVGIHSESDVTITNSAWDLAVARVTGTNGTLVVKIGNGSYSGPGGSYTLATSGNGYAIWINPTGAVTPVVTISPATGFYLGGTTVTLTSKYGTAPVNIYYTTDGSTPTASSTKYTAPFQVTVDQTTVKAIAIDNGGVSSTVASEIYTTVKPAPITLRFKAPTSWTSAKCHVWGGGLTSTVWPGNSVTKDANGYYTQVISDATSYPVNAVFNNGAYEQTVDLTASSDICWDYGTASGPGISGNPKKYSVTVATCVGSAPVASISPASGNYPGGTTVTLSSTGGAAPVKIYYTTDGSTPSASSTLYSAPFSVTVDNTTVKAIAIDNGSVASAVVSATYTTTVVTNITVKFKAPAGWSSVSVYAWKGASTAITASWPGDPLTLGGDGLYTYTTPVANSGFNVVFNNGSGTSQTVDILGIIGDACYQTTGSTSKYPVVTMSGCFTSLDVVKNSGDVSIYPNPAMSYFVVESNSVIDRVEVYSLTGSLVLSKECMSNTDKISLDGIENGFYTVVVYADGKRNTMKLVKR